MQDGADVVVAPNVGRKLVDTDECDHTHKGSSGVLQQSEANTSVLLQHVHVVPQNCHFDLPRVSQERNEISRFENTSEALSKNTPSIQPPFRGWFQGRVSD